MPDAAQVTCTWCAVRKSYVAVFRDFSRWRSRITRTSTPRLAAAVRSFSAVVSISSYIVRSIDDLAPLMSS